MAGLTPAGLEGRLLAGRYRLRRRLGQGASAEVWEAWDGKLARPVAVKVLHAVLAVLDPGRVDRLEREARALARVRSPGVVQVLDHHLGDTPAFLVTELVPGGRTLAGAVAEARDGFLEGPLGGPQDVVRLFRDLARALAEVHAQGVVHRDIKPANILLDQLPREGPRLRLADFGLARIQDLAGESLHTRGAVGTPPYMSPEQARGTRDVGPATDLYALGACLYEALTLERAVPATSLEEVLLWHRSRDPRPPSQVRRGLPRELDWICLKLLEPDPARRYRSAGALAEDLDRFLRNEPVRARRPSPLLRARKWLRRHPILATAQVAALLGLAVVSALLAVNRAARLEAEAERDRVAQAALLVEEFLDTLDPGLAERRNLESRRRLQQWSAFIAGNLLDQPDLAARLLVAVGRGSLYLDDYDGAIAPLRQAVALAEAGGGGAEEAATALDARLYLGWALGRTYDLDEAETHLAAVRAAAGPADPRYLLATNRLGQVRLEQLRHQEARDLFLEVQEALQAAGREDAGLWALNELDLGVLAFTLAGPEEALEHFRRSREAYLEAYGPYHPEMPYVLRGMAEALWKLGRREEAVARYREVLHLRERTLPPDSYEVVFDHLLLAAWQSSLHWHVPSLLELGTALRRARPAYMGRNRLAQGFRRVAVRVLWPLPPEAVLALAWVCPEPPGDP